MRFFLCVVLCLLLCTSAVWAADIPKGLVDSKPAEAININLDDWYAKHPIGDKKGLIVDTVYSSPRTMVTIRTGVKGWVSGAHYHATSDEIVVVVGGKGEILLNGKWVPVKAGDIHVCPRGIVHDTRALDENFRFLSIYSPQLPPGGDANFIDVPR
jgi:quercetin dioxygenase-like cupin family protein